MLNAVRCTLILFLLLSCFSGQALAVTFADGDLIRVVYSSDGTMETATDLGPIASLTTPITSNVTYSTNNFSIASLGASATPATSSVAYYSYNNPGSGEGQAWTSGNSGGQTAKFSSVNSFDNAYNQTTGLYFPSTSSPAQVTVLMSDPNSYYSQMDKSGGVAGQMAGYIPDGSAEAGLTALSSTGYVDQTLYYYLPTATRGANASGLAVADIRTYADGHTVLMASGGPTTYALTVNDTGTGSGTVTPNTGTLSWSGSTGIASYNSGTVVTLTAAPASGSSFAGWSGGGCSGTGTCSVTMNAATTVTATFALSSFTVTPSAGSGGSISPSTPQTVVYNNTTAFTVSPNTGYYISSVTGCGGTLSGNTYTTGPVTVNCSVTATFAQTIAGEYLLTVNETGSGTVTSSPTGINCGPACTAQFNSGTSVTLAATPTSGGSFTGWSGGGCSGAGNCIVTLSAATTVTATFTSNSFSVTPSVNGSGGSISPSTPQTAAYNGTIAFTVTPNTGYSIASVTGCGGTLSGSTYTTGPVTADCSVSATFAQAVAGQYALTINITGDGTVAANSGTISWSGSTGTASYSSGAEVTLTATATSGNNFTGWSGGGCSGVGTCTVTMNAATAVTAAFATATQDFNDVPIDYWAYSYIHAIYEAGLTQGCGNGNYCPSDPVTRGEIAAFITRELLGPNFTSYSLVPFFVDVPSTDPYFKYVQRLKDDGITEVPVGGTFNVDANATRDQMAAFLVRARQIHLGLDNTVTGPGPDIFPYTSTPWFTDVPSTDPFFEYVQYLKDNNITAVTGMYYPADDVTRDEMAAFLARAFLGMQ